MPFPSHNHPPLDDDFPRCEIRSAQRTFPLPERVIVFARFPEPGQVKTRLIPALGPDGAAQLQATLTRRTLDVARRFSVGRSCELEVRFTGGDASEMRSLFGDELHYSE